MQENHTDILILGNGVAGFSAASEIREIDDTVTITMLTMEEMAFYNRMLLSKMLTKSNMEEELVMQEDSWYKEHGIVCQKNSRVTKINTEEKSVEYEAFHCTPQGCLCDGPVSKIYYNTLIYALGARAFMPDIPGISQMGVSSLRTLLDARKIRKQLPKAEHVVIIGGGILGLETAWQLVQAGKKVAVVEAGERLMEKQLDETGSMFLMELLRMNRVEVFCGKTVMEIVTAQDRTGVSGVVIAQMPVEKENHEIAGVNREISGQMTLKAELVIVSCGNRPNTTLAKEAGITVDYGVMTDTGMQTDIPDIFACGDCAQFKNRTPLHGLWSEATATGKIAGANALSHYKGESLTHEYKKETTAFYFKGMDTVIYSIGQIQVKKEKMSDYSVERGMRFQELCDISAGTYEKYFYHKEKLVGAILIGVPDKIPEINARFL